MSRKLASFQKVLSVEPIDNADNIEKIKVLGWTLVAKKGEFKPNDICIYFEIDSLLDTTKSEFAFLEGRNMKVVEIDGEEYRGSVIKTMKLRGVVSQGLALPISILDEEMALEEGMDLTEYLGIVKYEKPIPAELSGQVKGQFPTFIPKTDETRLQADPDILNRHQDTIVQIRIKYDGSSCTIYKKNGEFGVCSRNLDLKETEGNTLWEIANRYNLKEKLPEGFAIQGEVYGEGIQGNPHKIKGQDIAIFNVYDINSQKYLDNIDFITFCRNLDIHEVELIEIGKKLSEYTLDNLIELANNTKLEGIVIRPITEEVDENIGRLSFKVISPKYLLKK